METFNYKECTFSLLSEDMTVLIRTGVGQLQRNLMIIKLYSNKLIRGSDACISTTD